MSNTALENDWNITGTVSAEAALYHLLLQQGSGHTPEKTLFARVQSMKVFDSIIGAHGPLLGKKRFWSGVPVKGLSDCNFDWNEEETQWTECKISDEK